MDNFIYEIFKDIPRLGPGCAESTKKAFYSIPKLDEDATILDVGCGNGYQTLILASLSSAKIVALDNYNGYLTDLAIKAKESNLNSKIQTIKGDMFNMPFSDVEFDVIWSEAAIYNIGFREGLKEWKSYLKKGGYLVVSDLVWFKEDPPDELQEFWRNEYPEMKDNALIVDIINSSGYELIRNFELPEYAWWDEFYTPLNKRIDRLNEKYKHDQEKRELLKMTRKEIEYYKIYPDYYGYMFYVMRSI